MSRSLWLGNHGSTFCDCCAFLRRYTVLKIAREPRVKTRYADAITEDERETMAFEAFY